MSFLATTYSSSNNGRAHNQANSSRSHQQRKTSKRESPKVSSALGLTVGSDLFKHNRSNSYNRTYQFSAGSKTPKNRRSSSIQIYGLNSSGRLINGHPLPQEFEEKDYQMKAKQEAINSKIASARSEIVAGNYDLALKNLNKVLQTQPNNPNGLKTRANCFINMSKHKLAIPDLLSIIQNNPKFNRNIYIALAVCFVELQDYASAIRQLSKCISLFSGYADAYINRGLLYNKEKRWDKAISDFHQAISINPSKGSSYIGLAESLIEMGDYVQAFEYLEKSLIDKSSRPLAFLKRGKIFFEQREFQKALKDFDEVLETDKENVGSQ